MTWDFFHVFSLLPHLAYAIPFKQHRDHYSFAQSISPKPDMTEDRGLKSYIFYSISLNHHKALINRKDKPASLEWQRSVLCVRGRTWFSSCSKCFFQCLSCVCLVGGGGLLLPPYQEEDTSKYAQVLRKTRGFTPYILNVERAFCLNQKDLLPWKSLQKSTLLVLKPFRAGRLKTEEKN